MLNLLPKLPLFKAFYYLGFPKILPVNYTISLTYACNSRCHTCRIYQKKTDDLTLDEYKKVFTSLGHSPYWGTFSGGEPSLKPNLAEIVNAFYDICKPNIINIPSNGILTEKIVSDIIKICEHCQKSQIIINLSIDGIGEQHDKIRNVPDNYTKVINTYNELRKLTIPPLTGGQGGGIPYYKNLSIGIHTVISRFNIKHFSAIANTLIQLNPDQYITEIAEQRVELGTTSLDISPTLLQYKAVVDFLIHRIKHTPIKHRLNRITQAFRIEYYTLVKRVLRDKRQVIPCYAGISSVQIAPDGDVWTCCIKAKPLGNLRETGYDFKKIWKGRGDAQSQSSSSDALITKERKSIKKRECYCPLANASYTNMLMDFPTLLRVFYRVFIRWYK